jgi:hypothetical protein
MASTAKLERDLSIVFTLESGAVVYSKPVARSVFEKNYLPLAKLYSSIQAQGLFYTGMSIAARMLRDLEASGEADASLLLADIYQRTQLALYIEPEKEGEVGRYEQYMMADAVRKKLIDEDDISEIENFLVFTIAASYLSGSKANAASIMRGILGMRRAQRTSLPLTEFLNSLLTSMQDELSGKKEAVQTAEQAE